MSKCLVLDPIGANQAGHHRLLKRRPQTREKRRDRIPSQLPPGPRQRRSAWVWPGNARLPTGPRQPRCGNIGKIHKPCRARHHTGYGWGIVAERRKPSMATAQPRTCALVLQLSQHLPQASRCHGIPGSRGPASNERPSPCRIVRNRIVPEALDFRARRRPCWARFRCVRQPHSAQKAA